MKKLLFFFLLLSITTACNKDSSLVGSIAKSVEGTSTRGEDSSTTTTTTTTGDAWTDEFMDLVNDHRATIGLRALINDPGLDEIAQGHSDDMANGTLPFGHTGFSSRCSLAYDVLGGGNLCGENVAMGQTSPKAAFTSWMNSPDHRANIEGPRYTHSGLGYAKSSSGTYYWTQIFLEKN